MTSDRAYRKGISSEEARQELRRHEGTQFDPQVVAAFLALKEEEFVPPEEDPKTSWRDGSVWDQE